MPAHLRRAIALALLALVLLLTWLLLIVPVSALASSQDEWRAATAHQIARDRGMVKSAARIREVSQMLRDAPIRTRLFAADAGNIDDQLQGDLRAALLQSGVEPTTFKVLPGGSMQGLRSHRVEFSSVMSVDQLRSLYTALEQGAHYIRVERLRIDAPSDQPTNQNPRMTLLMEAQGYSLETPPKSAAVRVARAD